MTDKDFIKKAIFESLAEMYENFTKANPESTFYDFVNFVISLANDSKIERLDIAID